VSEDRINYEDLPDHDILVLVARSCNQTEKHLAELNSKTAAQETRVKTLEVAIKTAKWFGGIGGSGGLVAGILKIAGIY